MAPDRSVSGWRIVTALAALLLAAPAVPLAAGLVSAGQLSGYPVRDVGGAPVGEVAEMLIDLRQGRIAYLLITTDESERPVVVPWRAVRVQTVPPSVRLAVSAERLRLAPAAAGLPHDRQVEQSIHSYYGVSPYWEADSFRSSPRPPKNLRIVP